tara:strand:- start:156 stop:530 length:375 start_codon:yes stop_codon:yes gene_type:complete
MLLKIAFLKFKYKKSKKIHFLSVIEENKRKDKSMSKVAKNDKWTDELEITKHFIERYSERILKMDKHIRLKKLRNQILKDMDTRLTDREKECIKLLINNKGTIKIPIDGTNQLIISNSVLVTVY